MLRLLLALIFSVLGLFQSDAMSSVVTPPTVPKSGLHSVSDKALTTSFTPVAKVTDGERYTIVHDYLGTPTQAYDSCGRLVWEMLLYVYGEVMECRGDRSLVPFRYQGQYENAETGLYYNRFRYYSPQMGMYISSDPIGLAGNNPTLYGYVGDVNTWLDIFGLLSADELAKVQKMGADAELIAQKKYGFSKNTTTIESIKTGKYHIPDGMTDTTIYEVKCVGKQGYTRQLKSYVAYAKKNNMNVVLIVQEGASLSKPLNEAKMRGDLDIVEVDLKTKIKSKATCH